MGQLLPSVTAEVDCESLFSEANQVAYPRRALTGIRLYEDLVTVKHRLGRIYCHVEDVKRVYLKKWKDDSWDKKGDKEVDAFLDSEMQGDEDSSDKDNSVNEEGEIQTDV